MTFMIFTKLVTKHNISQGVYEKAGSAGAGLLVWALAGALATLCTLAYAELGKYNVPCSD